MHDKSASVKLSEADLFFGPPGMAKECWGTIRLRVCADDEGRFGPTHGSLEHWECPCGAEGDSRESLSAHIYQQDTNAR